MVIVGPVFRPLGVGIHSFRDWRHLRPELRFQPFAGLKLSPLQAGDAGLRFLDPFDRPERPGKRPALGFEPLPGWGRPNSRVTSRQIGQSIGRRASMSRSKRPYGLT